MVKSKSVIRKQRGVVSYDRFGLSDIRVTFAFGVGRKNQGTPSGAP